MTDRHLEGFTGAYLRVQRDGKWEPYDIAELTPKELDYVFKDRDAAERLKWLKVVIHAIQEKIPF